MKEASEIATRRASYFNDSANKYMKATSLLARALEATAPPRLWTRAAVHDPERQMGEMAVQGGMILLTCASVLPSGRAQARCRHRGELRHVMRVWSCVDG